MINAEATLALISDLYAQLAQKSHEVEQLQQALAAARQQAE